MANYTKNQIRKRGKSRMVVAPRDPAGLLCARCSFPRFFIGGSHAHETQALLIIPRKNL